MEKNNKLQKYRRQQKYKSVLCGVCGSRWVYTEKEELYILVVAGEVFECPICGTKNKIEREA